MPTTVNAEQKRAFDLIDAIAVKTEHCTAIPGPLPNPTKLPLLWPQELQTRERPQPTYLSSDREKNSAGFSLNILSPRAIAALSRR